MKKNSARRELTIHRETLRGLQEAQLSRSAAGEILFTIPITCFPPCPTAGCGH